MYARFNAWRKDGSWQGVWLRLLRENGAHLDCSSVQLDGRPTGGNSMTLPAASAAPQSDGELTYAVPVQLFEQARQQTAQLAEVREWKDRLTVQLHLGKMDAGLSERKQVQLENGIR